MNAAVVPLRRGGAGIATAGNDRHRRGRDGSVQLEEQLRLSEKMASIGLLAAGVAHEVNTPLTGISSFTQMLLEGADPQDPRTRLLEKIERQTFRAAKIVNGLLTLSRPASSDRSSFDINVVITDVLGLLEHQFETHRIRVRRELSETPVMVLGLEHKLQQVFLNLFLNARDAMPKGGWLSITTRTEGNRVIAEVSDTGRDSERVLSRESTIRSSRRRRSGRALDLVCRSPTASSASTKAASSARAGSGQGTRFILSFPAVALERSSLAGQGMHGPGSWAGARSFVMRRNGSILVVDDEEIMREILDALLAREGYHVRLASSAEEGLDLARSFPFDAAIVDVMMPGMDGLAMLEELKKLDDDLPVLMVTAFASVETAITAMKRGAFDYITKPFKNDEVLVVVGTPSSVVS